MSMESIALNMSHRAVRQRLWNPPGGKLSEELDVLSPPLLRRQRVDSATERVRLIKQAKVDEQVARLEALKFAYVTTLSRRATEPLPPRPPSVQSIVAEVCRRYNVTQVDVRSQRRQASVVLPRQIIMYIARTITELSLPAIGRQLGNRDHTTVLHSVNKVTYLVDNNPHLAAEITDIIATINAGQAQRAIDPIAGEVRAGAG